MERSWVRGGDGPQRNEIRDALIKRYGVPLAIRYSDTEDGGDFLMFWGTSVKPLAKDGKSSPSLSGPKFTPNKIDCSKVPVDRLDDCYRRQVNADLKPFFDVMDRETDVRVVASVATYSKSPAEVSKFSLSTEDVGPDALASKEMVAAENARKASAERLKQEKRGAIQPGF